MSTRETIHVSLGPSANAISAHLLNLQGLAATDAESTCNPNVTHSIAKETYVPRVLICDQAPQFSTLQHSSTRIKEETVSTWNGALHHVEQDDDEQVGDTPASGALQEAASALAFSSYSRYHVSRNQQSQYTSTTSSERHFNWNDLGDEEEEEEDAEELARRQERNKLKWQLQTVQPLEEQLDTFWKETPYDSLSWMEYWMPPRPSYQNYAVPLTCSNAMQQHWDTYQMGTCSADDLLEKLRGVFETCDSVQGATMVSQGHGIYAGLTSALLQELQDECKTAGRFVLNVVDSENDASSFAEKENGSSKEVGWQPAHAQRVRRQLQSGLALYDFSSRAHAVLPLLLQYGKESSLFAASAQVALALETATLGYRLNDNHKSRIGLNGGFYNGVGPSDQGYGVASNLSFGEYLACLQPSSQYCMLELEIMSASDSTWSQALFQGTSLERQQMLQRGGRDANVQRARDVLPGEWLDSNTNNGKMTSLSPEMGTSNRSVHRQFALTSSLRPASSTNVSAFSTSQYLTFLMEGMAFRYRPEVSMGTVLNESAFALTSGGYGAGSYWKYLFPEGNKSPVLSVTSNSTRSYGYLNSVSSGMQQVLSPRFKGYLNRDTAEGILPDAEDCMEAMEKCLDLRDLYAPPEGSGLVVDSEGTYFDVDS